MKYIQPIGGAVDDPYVDANPVGGIEGSPVPAAAIEDPQREIVAVITGAGLVPDDADLTQLRQAIAKMIQAGQRAVVIDAAVFAPAVVGTGKAVYWDNANNRFDLAQADGSAKQNCVGFADVASGNVYAFGDAVLFAGLTPGARYYLDAATAGAITTVAPANVVMVGIARSATEVFVDIDAVPSAAASGIQGAHRKLVGSATGLNAVVTYAIDELTTGDGAGNYQTLRAWAGTITMTTLGSSGLDVGAVAANTWYYAYGISKPDGTKAFIASLADTGPSFANAAGYTKWALIGAFRTDGTANKYPLIFRQFGRFSWWGVAAGSNLTALPLMASGVAGSVSTPTWIAIALGAFIPPNAARLLGVLAAASGSSSMVAPNNGYGAYNSTTNPPPVVSASASGASTQENYMFELAPESTNIYWASNSANTAVRAAGWENNL